MEGRHSRVLPSLLIRTGFDCCSAAAGRFSHPTCRAPSTVSFSASYGRQLLPPRFKFRTNCCCWIPRRRMRFHGTGNWPKVASAADSCGWSAMILPESSSSLKEMAESSAVCVPAPTLLRARRRLMWRCVHLSTSRARQLLPPDCCRRCYPPNPTVS